MSDIGENRLAGAARVPDPPMTLTACRLRVSCLTQTPLRLPPVAGPVLRGALLAALRDRYCPALTSSECGVVPFRPACLICPLVVSAEGGSAGHRFGAGAPRPFTVEPPLDVRADLRAGDAFSFGLTLFGDARALLPYVLDGVTAMGARGVGDGTAAPGRFMMRKIETVDVVDGLRPRVDVSDATAGDMPLQWIMHAMVVERAARLPCDAVALDLLTPMRLVRDGVLVHRLTFDALLRRVLRRVDALALATSGQGLNAPFADLVDAARDVSVARDETRWLDAFSPSSRTGRSTPIGGLVGRITFAGDLTPFLPWLVWGEITHVGKDATKGNGWYRLGAPRRDALSTIT